MANPNIVAVTSILGNTTFLTPSDTAANVLLSNAASSGDVLKINQIVAANVNGTSAVDTTVAINDAAAGAGTSFPIVSTVSVPADASIIVTDKTTAIYLMEDQSIVVTSGTSSGISYTISYEAISSS
jgi:MinD superfamily P-loop ATPase